MNITKTLLCTGIAASALTVGLPGEAQASSHREAPAIAEDQFADNTDVYSFISPNDPGRLVIVANYVPLLLPFSGPNFYKFSDSVSYEMRIDNDGDARTDIVYAFRFQTQTLNGATFLYNVGPVTGLDDANLNVRQTYTVRKGTRQPSGFFTVETLAQNVPVAPWYVGDRSFPDGSYDAVAQEAIAGTEEGGLVFAGPRDESFFVDLHVFDLLGVGGFPSTDGVNVMSIAMEVPITELTEDGDRPAADATGLDTVVGVHAAARRRSVTIRFSQGPDGHFGGFKQISRLALPLVNEVIIPLQDKDKYNRSRPQHDVANFGAYVLNPELTGLLAGVLGLPCPPPPAGGRTDIVALLSPAGTTPADLLRIDIRQGQTFAESVFPNGRWLEDDVTDTMLTVACGGDIAVGDGVDGNDKKFLQRMPYLASPHSGNPL